MTTTFIKFSLQDKNGQAILGIDDGALQQSLIMEIKNPDFDRNIAIASLKEDKDYHFRLNFRPGTLLLSNLDKVTLSEKNRQEKWELKKDKDSFIFTYRGEKEIVLEPNAKNILIFTLENISAEPGGGARGTRVELEYQNLFYAADNKNPISGTLLQYINIVNQRGNQQIPLYIGFTGSDKVETQPQKIDVGNKTLEEGITKPQTISINNLRVVGSNRILNDGTPNELILTFRHLQKNPFQKKENEAGLSLRGTDKHKDAATNFKISFDVMPKESLQNIKKIGLDIRQLANNIVQQADNFLKSQDDSKLLQQQIELIAKKIEEVPTNKLASIPQAEVDSLTSVVEPVESVTVPLGVLNQAAEAEIIEKGTQQISQAILNLEELPLPVIKITEAIQDIKDASLNLDRLYKKLTDASQEKPPILTEIKAKAQSIHYPVKIILYWAQKLKEDPREALLCVTDASKVEIKFNQDSFTPDWEIVPNLQGASPQWTITRKTTATELTGEILRLEIKNLITILPAGYGKKIIKQIFQETLNKFPEQDFPEVTVTKILINGKPLSDQEEILLIYDANTMQCRIEIFNKSLKESSFAKDQVYAVEWEKFAEDPSKVIAVKASKSSNRDNALGLDLGNSTGLKYDQTTSKLGIWVSSKEELQVVPNGINIPNGNVGIINGNVGIGTTNPQAKLHIEGTLRIGSSRSQESRQVNKIVIGDGECVQIGEWEENDILSIKAKRISLSVGSITPVTGGKMGLKNCQNNKYISCDGNFSWRDKLDTYENFTLEMSCSRELKENIVSLTTEEAISTITQLNAVKYDYKGEPAFRPNLGFIAEEMPDNLASADRKTLSPFEVIPVLTKVVQEQQRKIESLQLEVSELQKKLNQSEVHKEEG